MTLILKRASASRVSGEWSDDDYDVIADGAVVGRFMKAAAGAQQHALERQRQRHGASCYGWAGLGDKRDGNQNRRKHATLDYCRARLRHPTMCGDSFSSA